MHDGCRYKAYYQAKHGKFDRFEKGGHAKVKKIDLVCINILHKQKSSLIILIIMIFMMFLINQSIGYARYLHLQNSIYNAANDNDKLYWIDLRVYKSIELNEAFKDADTDEKYLNIAKKEIKKLPHVSDVSFIGRYEVTGNHTIDVYGYDESMMSMIDLLIKEGNPISSENMNEVLISKELSDVYKIGDNIYINKDREITNQNTGYMELNVIGIVDNAKFLPGIIYSNKNIIVCSYKMLENYGIYDYFHSAVVRTDNSSDLSSIYNETSPELGFFTKFDSYYNISGNTEYLTKNLTRQIGILIICLVGISSLNFAGLYEKKYEYGIYFLCGASIWDIIFLSTSKNLILIFLSTIAGYFLTVQLSAVNEIIDRIYDLNTYAISFLIALAIYIISSIPVYVELKSQELIQLVKDVK
ncbi:MAG TPA: hypothetical protein DHU59_01315 [Clostridiales bacterium]|nr:hypothetical protein [Clostridiales bacterium]